jgi:mono/diheme cytochrome c family protein
MDATTPTRPTPTTLRPPSRPARRLTLAAALLATLLGSAAASAATPAELLGGYTGQSGVAAQPERGRSFFTQTHGREWSCASCHSARPVQAGQHAGTGKPIAALAPAGDARRFTDPAKVEKWFRRNCNDVLSRECTATEKADVLAWLIGLQP